MLSFLTPYVAGIKVGAIVILVSIIGFHLLKDRETQIELKAKINEITSLQEQVKTTQDQLINVTRDRDSYLKTVEQANKARAEIQANLSAALVKLKAQKPPVECKAAIDWSIDNKYDLNWESKK